MCFHATSTSSILTLCNKLGYHEAAGQRSSRPLHLVCFTGWWGSWVFVILVTFSAAERVWCLPPPSQSPWLCAVLPCPWWVYQDFCSWCLFRFQQKVFKDSLERWHTIQGIWHSSWSYVFLLQLGVFVFAYVCVWKLGPQRCTMKAFFTEWRQNLTTENGFFELLSMIMELMPYSIILAGLPCSLFIFLSSKHHGRKEDKPFGNEKPESVVSICWLGHQGNTKLKNCYLRPAMLDLRKKYKDVYQANLIVRNWVVLMIIAVARSMFVICEQPMTSMMLTCAYVAGPWGFHTWQPNQT